jgi:uncharacterized protein (DUF2147 family)
MMSALPMSAGATVASAADITRAWVTEEREALIRIAPCGAGGDRVVVTGQPIAKGADGMRIQVFGICSGQNGARERSVASGQCGKSKWKRRPSRPACPAH